MSVAFQSFQSSAAPAQTKQLIDQQVISTLLERNTDSIFAEQMAKKILDECPVPEHNNDGKRYRFSASHREKLLNMVFDYSFKENPDALIEAAEAEVGPEEKFYSGWKKVCYIAVPEVMSAVFGNKVLQLAVNIATFIGFFYFSFMLFEVTEYAFTAHVIPFMINNTPLAVIQFGNYLFELKEIILDNIFPILIVLFCAQYAVDYLPEIPYVSAALRAINVIGIFQALYSADTLCWFLCGRSYDVVTFASSLMENASSVFHEVARKGEHERITVCKARSYREWNRIVRDNAPQIRVEHQEQKVG